MTTWHILQYSYSIMIGSATVCCCTDCINCTAVDGWKKCTEGIAVATQLPQTWCYGGTVWCAVQRQIALLPVLQWHCLLCSTAIDCCSTGAIVARSAVQYSDRLLFYWCYSGTVYCAVQREIAVLPVLQWRCLLCSTAIDCCSTVIHKLLDTERSVTSNIVTMEERNIGCNTGLCLHTASRNNSHPQFRSLSTHSFM
jgi:hypothetical protein